MFLLAAGSLLIVLTTNAISLQMSQILEAVFDAIEYKLAVMERQRANRLRSQQFISANSSIAQTEIG
jgi:hypothetical protein